MSRFEMKNDALYEATSEASRLQDSLTALQDECETELEKRRQTMERDFRKDRELYGKDL
jgi:predicted DNA-binding protein (UPF0251 family)